jgi:hypothetical protein
MNTNENGRNGDPPQKSTVSKHFPISAIMDSYLVPTTDIVEFVYEYNEQCDRYRCTFTMIELKTTPSRIDSKHPGLSLSNVLSSSMRNRVGQYYCYCESAGNQLSSHDFVVVAPVHVSGREGLDLIYPSL